MTISRRAVAALVLSLLAVLTGVAASPLATPAQAACPIDQPDCGTPGTTTEFATRSLHVSVGVGTVTGDVGGATINCTVNGGTGCNKSVQVSRDCSEFGCDPWPAGTAFSLTATGGPAGYQARWGSVCAGGATCGGDLGSESNGDDSLSITLTWADVTAPLVSFTPPAKVGGNGTVSASALDNSGSIARYVWTVDAVVLASTGSVLSLSSFSQGVHSVTVEAVDAAGNHSAAVSRDVLVDKSVSVQTNELPAYTNAATVPWTFTVDPDVTATSCRVDDGGPVACVSGWSGVDAESPDGTYGYSVQVTDDVGNTATSATQSFVLDRTAPSVDISDGPADGTAIGKRTAAFTVSSSDANPGTLTCTLDDAPVECAAGATVSLTGLVDGEHTFAAEATDLAGNSSSLDRTFTVAADRFSPKVSADWHVAGSKTTFRRITVKHLPSSATAVLRCGHSKSCAWKSRTIDHPRTTVSVLKGLGHPSLKKGARLTLTLTNAVGKERVTTWTVRADRSPRVTTS